MSKWTGTVIVLLASGNAIANETVVAAIQAYESCLQTSFNSRMATATEPKTSAADEAIASCTNERSRIDALVPPAQMSAILARVDAIARAALTK